MSRPKIVFGILLVASLLANASPFPAPLAQAAPPAKVGRPLVATGNSTKARGSSATLVGTVNPNGAATSYFFQYGPTIAYGKQTTAANLAAGSAKVKVGQAVTGLLAGYHYRLVATNIDGTSPGNDRVFALKGAVLKPKFTFPKGDNATAFGSSYILSGSISGTGNANRSLELESSPFPFLAPFVTVGLPVQTNPAGAFSFRVASLSMNTQFRVSTLDPRPVYSQIVTHDVSPRITFKVRSAGHAGLVRLYGTVTPAKVGARVSFQLRKSIRPGKSEKTTRFATQFSTTVKRGTKTVARFSAVETIRTGGIYQAYVVLPKGALASGASASRLLHAAPASTGNAKGSGK